MAYYQDIPLPRRTEQPSGVPGRNTSVPEHFRLKLAFDPAGKTLKLSAFLNDTPAFYRGRGYFTERPSDLPGTGFRVAVVGLLDPFLTGKTGIIEAKHFPITLRVVVPKLRRDGVQVECELEISEELPVAFHVQWKEDAQAVSLCVVDTVPRESLEICANLESCCISGNTLYSLNSMQIKELEAYPAGEKLLTAAEWGQLFRFQERYPRFFQTAEVFQVRRLLQEREQTESEKRSEGIFSLWDTGSQEISHTPTKSSRKTIEAAESKIPPRRSEIISLPGPLLESAEMSFSLGNQMYASRTALFLHDAQRLKNYAVTKARFMPFRTGRPTYQDMNLTQRSWYFYWRSRFRSGVLEKTDIAYLYVAIYELINQVTASGAEALSRLLRLWEGYRADFPYLDLCMPGWCVDFMLLNHLGTDFDAIHERIPFRLTDCSVPAELFLNRRLQEGLSKLPLSLLSRFSEYDVCSSRFYEAEANRKSMEELVRRALETAEQASLAQGMSFLDSFHVRKAEFYRESYYAAMIDRASARRIILKYQPLIGNHDFQKTLAGILRACENALRRRERFPGRLKEEKLPTYLSEALVPLLERVSQRPIETKKVRTPIEEERPPQKPLVIDLSRARDLEEQSWENTRRLLDALGEEAAQEPETSEIQESAESKKEKQEILPEEKPIITNETSIQTKHKEIVFDSTEDFDENGLFAALSETAAAVLKALAAGESAEVRRICTENMTFPEAVYEEINEAALDTIGDLLLDTATGEIFEDYRKMVSAENEKQ